MPPQSHDEGRLPCVTVVTHSPSPYQVELFDAVQGLHRIKLKVIYLYARDEQRMWQPPAPLHASVMLSRPDVNTAEVLAETVASNLVVINYYKHPFAKAVMQRRTSVGGAMCFWGERPQPNALPLLSSLLRKWKLRSLLRSRAQFWGIGGMAVEAYRGEFGPARTYVDLPYFSDLKRFGEVTRKAVNGKRVFLFSGALSHRKGVDLLASAFARLVPDFPQVRLRIMGSGPMEEIMRRRLEPCAGKVEFIGFRDWKDLPLEYAKADILCVPSRHDGWGLVVPEGLAAGLPVIGTDQTGAAVEFVRPGRNGWLIPKDDEEAMYRAMSDAASIDGSQWSEMSGLARESVADHSLQRGAEQFVQAACSAIADWHPKQGDANALSTAS